MIPFSHSRKSSLSIASTPTPWKDSISLSSLPASQADRAYSLRQTRRQKNSKPQSGLDTEYVTWTGQVDPENPFNWAVAKKWRVTILACFMTFVVQINGTMLTSAAEQINESFHVTDEHFPHSYWPILSWNLGGAAAPLLGLPLMENFGVRYSYMAIYLVLIIFIIPQAAATNFATLIVTRIFTGACSGVLANITSGIVSDVWNEGYSKSFGTSLYIWGLLAGLSMGPVLGSLTVHHTTWRW